MVQWSLLDEALKTSRFVRNRALPVVYTKTVFVDGGKFGHRKLQTVSFSTLSNYLGPVCCDRSRKDA
jgi:hypothetical protein